ncbi:MAG: tRNA (adenosine(37)-N6)-threonylcarbamoyltransferase complex dimerization subunit type 1 TsaB [Mycobacterium sp.]|nr:tRNA (adenosine(37)-N6)-threonylcarbamoyltransferase complex dimerization subunit type 1 TsaB [Mycobacterium sp.]
MAADVTQPILTIDTSTSAVVAGVVSRAGDGAVTVMAERSVLNSRGHAELLTPNVVAAVADAGLTMGDLRAVVVGCGPGPFTGLRVGMATAAAIGHALAIPVHGVCSLDAIGVWTVGAAVVVTDARRREVYWARYHDGVRVAGPFVDAPGDVPVGGAHSAAGSPDHAALIGLPTSGPAFPTPAGLLGVADLSAEPQPLVPLYLRRPDAKTLAERGVR